MASQQDNQHLQVIYQQFFSALFNNTFEKETGLNNHICLTL